jgi:DNA-binding response OmpR family regulator
MVVDEDVDALESLKLLLESYFDVCLTRNGAECLMEMDRGFRPDAILLELGKPTVDEPALLAELKRRGAGIPVLVVSAQPDAEEKARELGLKDVLRRPFTYEQLKAKLEQVLKGTGGSLARKGFLAGFILVVG